MRIFYFMVLVIGGLAGGCREDGSGKLEEALALAGKNRTELEKVLEYYSQHPEDSLKLKAAMFLIENMPGHYTLDGPYIRAYRAKIDTMSNLSFQVREVLYTIPFEYPELRRELTAVEDITHLTADYLIGHIESVFQQRDTCPWFEDLDFEIFREYLLPYRTGNEILSTQADSISPFQEELDFSARYYDNCRYSIDQIVTQNISINKQEYPIPDSVIQSYTYGYNAAYKATWIALRTSGIPTTLDFVPVQKNIFSHTQWIRSMDSRLQQNDPGKVRGLRIGKVYRKSFSQNALPHPDSPEYIPPFFRDPFNRDVTDVYMHTVDVELRFTPQPENQYVYLAIFDDREWVPVAFSKVTDNRCQFRKLGKNAVYLPIEYREGEIHPLASPFILRGNNRIRSLKIHRDSSQTIELKRMQPYYEFMNYTNAYFPNVRFECSDDRNFEHTEVVHVIKQRPNYEYETIKVDKTKKKRFWRIINSYDYLCLAELEFINEQGEQFYGKSTGPDTLGNVLLYDHNPSTCKTLKQWVGLDFGQPVSIAQIRYLSKNDGYIIYPGHLYELLYYDTHRWHSAGIKKATGTQLVYAGIPVNTLYQLKDLTEGKNGCMFTSENGKVRFW